MTSAAFFFLFSRSNLQGEAHTLQRWGEIAVATETMVVNTAMK